MASYLITGTSRGLGLEIVKQLVLSKDVGTILATSRAPQPSAALQTIISNHSNVHYVSLDIDDDASIRSATSSAAKTLGDAGLDVLVNNAAIQLLEEKGATVMQHLQQTLSTNVVAAHNVSAAFLPLLEQGRLKKLCNITSTLGSMALKDYSALAPFPSYKISKAALNMMTVQYSLQLKPKGFTVFCVSPGWLQTDLGGAQADLPPETGAKEVVRIIMEATAEDNGAFKNIHVQGSSLYDGQNAPW